MTSFASQLESILFFKGEPVSLRELAKTLSISESEVRTAALELQQHLASEGRGIRLMHNDGTYQLATAPEMSSKIQQLIKEDLQKDLSKASLETLAIVLYYGPVTRARIDHIRGVNSSFSVRALSIRGLIDRTENPHDQRSYIYTPSFQLLSYLGVEDATQLPEYTVMREEMRQFDTREEEKISDNPAPQSAH